MPEYDERGLLGLAFDPDFARNGRFFVYYGAPVRADAAADQDHTDTLSEFHVSASDPDRADPASERYVLRFEQPQPNHSGGALGFGPDGLLYLGTGDGGGSGDASPGHSPQGNAQDRTRLNGKILQIDVGPDTGKPYTIPDGNAFAKAADGRPEIYAHGFRNPWRLSWEPDGAKRLLVSDVGYGRFEEIDAVESGGNYGWRVREGAHCLNVEFPLVDLPDCDMTDDLGRPLIDPVLEYTHQAVGIAVVGGVRLPRPGDPGAPRPLRLRRLHAGLLRRGDRQRDDAGRRPDVRRRCGLAVAPACAARRRREPVRHRHGRRCRRRAVRVDADRVRAGRRDRRDPADRAARLRREAHSRAEARGCRTGRRLAL